MSQGYGTRYPKADEIPNSQKDQRTCIGYPYMTIIILLLLIMIISIITSIIFIISTINC